MTTRTYRIKLNIGMLAVGMTVGLAFAALADGLPYDARVEYLEAPRNASKKVSYIDTGICPSNDVGALVRVMPLHATDDLTVFGARNATSGEHIWKWFVGFSGGTKGYLTRGKANPDARFTYSGNKAYDIYLNYRNDRDRRIVEVDGTYAFNLPIPETDEWPDEYVTCSVYLFGNNQNGATGSSFTGNTGYARIYSAKFTKGGETIMDLVPVRKDGVGYFYDRISGRLLGKTGTSSTPAFTYGADIHAVSGSVKLDAADDWSNDGTVWLDDDAVLDLNGHTLTVAKVAGTGTITDTSAGEPGTLSFTVADNAENLGSVSVTGNLKVKTTLDLPYDAQVEYLEAVDATPGVYPHRVSYIDTGLYPGNDVGVRLCVMPLHETRESTVCGVRSDYNGSQFKWYMGFIDGTRGYLAWDYPGYPGTRFKYSANKQYDIYFNYLNDRNRKVVARNEDYVFNYAITLEWPEVAATNTVYLFGLNQNGATGSAFSGNDGLSRIYSAKFTKGTETVMDLIPVRKDGVGYFYDKVGGKLLGKTGTDATPDFIYGADVDATISGNIRLDADVDWSGLGRVLFDTDAVIDLNGHTLTVADVFGNGTVTDTSKGAPGTLCFNVGDGVNVVSTLALTGNLKVEKQGLGTLQLNRAGQTFTGGVLVSGGTAKAVSGNNEASNYWGPANGEITVAKGATFDVMGNLGFYTKRLVLSGGTLDNNAVMTSSLTDGIGNVTLTENSYLRNKQWNCGMTFSPADDGSRKVDLGGKTLTVDIGFGGQLYLKIPVVNGTLDIVNGGYLYIPSGATGGSDSVDLRMSAAACYLIGDFEVRDYYAAHTGSYNHGGGRFLVHGTFTPVTAADGKDRFHGCLMMDGSKIDLSSRTKPFNVVSQGYTGTGDMDGNRTMSFADGATVTILLGDRGASRVSKIVDWSAAVPSNLDTLTFRGVYADGTTHTLKKKEDGLYNSVGLMIIFR